MLKYPELHPVLRVVEAMQVELNLIYSDDNSVLFLVLTPMKVKNTK